MKHKYRSYILYYTTNYNTLKLQVDPFVCHNKGIQMDYKLRNYIYLLTVLLMTIRLGTHLSPTIFSDAAILHVCNQQQIASGNKLFLVILSL